MSLKIESVWWDETHQCNVVVTPMPGSVPGAVTVAEDGSYVILINAAKCDSDRRMAYRHECVHIDMDDLYSDESVQTIESRTHGKAG